MLQRVIDKCKRNCCSAVSQLLFCPVSHWRGVPIVRLQRAVDLESVLNIDEGVAQNSYCLDGIDWLTIDRKSFLTQDYKSIAFDLLCIIWVWVWNQQIMTESFGSAFWFECERVPCPAFASKNITGISCNINVAIRSVWDIERVVVSFEFQNSGFSTNGRRGIGDSEDFCCFNTTRWLLIALYGENCAEPMFMERERNLLWRHGLNGQSRVRASRNEAEQWSESEEMYCGWKSTFHTLPLVIQRNYTRVSSLSRGLALLCNCRCWRSLSYSWHRAFRRTYLCLCCNGWRHKL